MTVIQLSVRVFELLTTLLQNHTLLANFEIDFVDTSLCADRSFCNRKQKSVSSRKVPRTITLQEIMGNTIRFPNRWLVWRSGHSVGHHTNKDKLCRARLVLRLVTGIFKANLPTQPGHPSLGRCNEYWRWSRQLQGTKRRVLRTSRPCNQDCWHSGLKALAVNLSKPSD